MKRFKVFYLYSNWKWTGPAEPALRFAEALAQKDVEIHFFSSLPPKGDPPILRNKVEEAAKSSGILLRNELTLSKHIRYIQNLRDGRKLARLIQEEKPHLIHTHLTNDHLVAALAKPKIPIVRSLFESQWPYFRSKYCFRHYTSHIFTIGKIYQEQITTTFGFPKDKITLVETGVDPKRFSPHRSLPSLRKKWGLSPQDLIIGMVARIQPHRRFEIFLEAFKKLAPQFPHLKALIVGRGTHIQEVAIQPVIQAGLEDRFVFTGYLEGDDYVGALKMMDIFVFMVPGRDGSCRAVREAMYMGLPVLAGKMGILPEIMEASKGGKIFEYDPENLANLLKNWILHQEERERAGIQGQKYATQHFSYSQEREKIIQVYKELLQND